MKCGVIVAVVIIVVTLFLTGSATNSQSNHHHPTGAISGATGRFYDTWKMPHNRSASCCSNKDCYAVEAHRREGVWFFKHRETGRMLSVPESRIERERDNPDGLNHVCANPQGMVYCFIEGGGN
jgi:hypothetical protein